MFGHQELECRFSISDELNGDGSRHALVFCPAWWERRNKRRK